MTLETVVAWIGLGFLGGVLFGAYIATKRSLEERARAHHPSRRSPLLIYGDLERLYDEPPSPERERAIRDLFREAGL